MTPRAVRDSFQIKTETQFPYQIIDLLKVLHTVTSNSRAFSTPQKETPYPRAVTPTSSPAPPASDHHRSAFRPHRLLFSRHGIINGIVGNVRFGAWLLGRTRRARRPWREADLAPPRGGLVLRRSGAPQPARPLLRPRALGALLAFRRDGASLPHVCTSVCVRVLCVRVVVFILLHASEGNCW